MDDFLLFANDEATLTHPHPATEGMPCLGFIIFLQRHRLKRRKGLYFQHKLPAMMAACRAGHVPLAAVTASVQGWVNQGAPWQYRQLTLGCVGTFVEDIFNTGGAAMEPLTLATTAVAFLSPYLSPYLVTAGEKAAEEVGKKLPEAVARVWNAIMTRFRGNVVAEAAVQDLAEQPDDQLNQSTFANQLRKVLQAEPAFATELAHRLEETKRQSGDIITNTGSGAVATSGGVAAGADGVAVGGDVEGGISIGGSEKKG